MRVVVTGATGFVGSHLIDALLARGDTVTALVRSETKAAPLARRGVRVVISDLGDVAATVQVISGHDVVYHAAGLTSARTEAEFMATNRDLTARLVEAAVQAGRPRFVLVSSLAAAGPSPREQPHSGDEPSRPVTRYGRSKLAGEEVVRASPLDWTIVRPPAVYGPGDREMFRVFRATSLRVGPVFGDGSQLVSLVFGPDLALGLVAAGTSPATSGRLFYACHPERLTTRQVVELAGAASGRRPMVIPIPASLSRAALWVADSAARVAGKATILSRDKAAEFLAPAWLADPAPLTRLTGWEASHDFARGAKVTAEWYRANRWL
jgi:nucleoside-diphosphate-sugar epimerase